MESTLLNRNTMIGKRAAEHDVASLSIPDPFILVVTSHHSFHFEIALRLHEGCGLDMTRAQIFYQESLQIRASTKMLHSPPKNTIK